MSARKVHCLLMAAFIVASVSDLFAGPKLPDDILWLTNNRSPVFAAPEAEKGGTFRAYFTSFPLTIRTVGPDSNTGIRGHILGNQLSLTNLHPNTEEILPELATHWAFGKDKKTMYFQLDRRARWSDGRPVTADDYLYTLTFMRSKNIVAPWYNNYYTEEIKEVIKYDDYTIAVVAGKAMPDLHMTVSISPLPRHFYGVVPKDFVKRYNWKIVPNTGPYQIGKIVKGKSISFKRKKDWWAKDLKYFKGRFNVNKVTIKVIREEVSAFEYFKKNKLDAFSLMLPNFWHEKAKNLEIFDKGYIKKMWFYVDSPQPTTGLWLNQDIELFKDRTVRYAFHHAMNVDKVINEVLRGDSSRLHSGTIGYGKYTNPEIKAREYNIGKVEKLMMAAGWKRGSDGIWMKGNLRFSVKVLYGYKEYTQRLVVLKEEAKKAGVELELQLLSGLSMVKTALEKKHEVAVITQSGGLRPRYWQTFHSVHAHKPQTNNLTNTDDPALDKLIDSFRTTMEVDKRVKLAWKIQEKIYEIAPVVPTFKTNYFRTAYWRWWRFPKIPATKLSSGLFEPFSTGLFWFDKRMKKETEKAMKTGRKFKSESITETTFKND